ncbi:MAG TPA: DUF4886 domain-containing protein [Bacteroidia bacterium]|nr:DUF4886 domain-containing protein [Bacteroidia bacterium]
MPVLLRSLLLLALLLPATAGLAEGRTVRLLTIGNSFSRNATNHLGGLAEAGGHKLIHRPIVVGGASLELHATKAQKHEADPEDKEGKYTNGRSLVDELRDGPWDFVTIQQASIKSHDLATYRPYAKWLADCIAEYSPGAKLLVHQTWAYRVDDPRFTKPSGKPGEPKTQEEMYRGLTKAYRTIAAELGTGLLPVGDAFFLADTDAGRGYRPDPGFDPRTAQLPALPEQRHSLHVGWRWAVPKSGGEKKLGMDGHHANLAGEYLGACVWHEVLFGASPVGNAYVPKGLDPDYAKFLQETAHRVAAAESERTGGK